MKYEFKGTPGPWEIVEHNWYETSIVKGSHTIAQLLIPDDAVDYDNIDDVIERHDLEELLSYNAHLIAAAPELLDAAIEAFKIMRMINEWHLPNSNDKLPFRQARNNLNAAIEKALGIIQ